MKHTKITQWLAAMLLALSLMVTPGCQVNPATGQSQFNVLSEREEIEIGEQYSPEFLEEFGGPIPNERIQSYVREIGMEMAAISERPDLPWEFHTLDSGVINAFALPGGKVFISRGLMVEFENEAQLAAVIGHEIGHVTAQHIGQQMSRAAATQAGLGILGVAVAGTDWGPLLGVGAELGSGVYLLSFGREQENEADELGMRYMSRVGYNPAAALKVMEVLRAAGGGGGIEWLSTHPAPDTRVSRVQRVLDRDYPDHDDADEYRLGRDSYRENVLEELRKMPAPTHGASQQGSLGPIMRHAHAGCAACVH
ncbi:M48 family metalloprotease [Phycisphaerales bacterium AB-hyl4]|uniref:M48 family metalloprotease n=1 Tax=Natronomicrosphaera hydrolytica TaxID=3242702 RepID=A0ABV4U663_9BACT